MWNVPNGAHWVGLRRTLWIATSYNSLFVRDAHTCVYICLSVYLCVCRCSIVSWRWTPAQVLTSARRQVSSPGKPVSRLSASCKHVTMNNVNSVIYIYFLYILIINRSCICWGWFCFWCFLLCYCGKIYFLNLVKTVLFYKNVWFPKWNLFLLMHGCMVKTWHGIYFMFMLLWTCISEDSVACYHHVWQRWGSYLTSCHVQCVGCTFVCMEEMSMSCILVYLCCVHASFRGKRHPSD